MVGFFGGVRFNIIFPYFFLNTVWQVNVPALRNEIILPEKQKVCVIKNKTEKVKDLRSFITSCVSLGISPCRIP